MNAVFRTIDLTCLTATPVLAGLVFTYVNYGKYRSSVQRNRLLQVVRAGDQVGALYSTLISVAGPDLFDTDPDQTSF
jgi:hypothetical protein